MAEPRIYRAIPVELELRTYQADLSGADLSGTDISSRTRRVGEANLSGVDFTNSNLKSVDFSFSDLTGAVMTGADISGAKFHECGLRNVDFSTADTSAVKEDLFRVLRITNEATAVLEAVRTGRIDGDSYYGSCACLLGTIANSKGYGRCVGAHHNDFDEIRDATSPIEVWFMHIQPGGKPDNNQFSRIAEGWLVEWINEHKHEERLDGCTTQTP